MVGDIPVPDQLYDQVTEPLALISGLPNLMGEPGEASKGDYPSRRL